jgi:hypothetical protein
MQLAVGRNDVLATVDNYETHEQAVGFVTLTTNGRAEGSMATYLQDGWEVKAASLITCDRNIRHQQNLAGGQLALIELTTKQWATIRDNIADVLAVIDAATPDSYATIGFPKPPRQRRPYPRP